MNYMYLLLIPLCLFMTGCQTSYKQAVNSDTKPQFEIREFQTKNYSGISKTQTMRSVIDVLQNLGFLIDKGNFFTGTVLATKLDGYQVTMSVVVKKNGRGVKVIAKIKVENRSVKTPKMYQDFFMLLDK